MALRTNYNDGGATQTTSNVTASDMNAISAQVNTNTSDIGRGWIDITDYGASPSNSDNHTYIQNALNAAGGIPVYVPPIGEFNVATTLTMNPGQVLIGATGVGQSFDTVGAGIPWTHFSSIGAASSMNAPVITIPQGVAHGRIRDLVIDGNGGNNTSTVGISISDATSQEECQWIIERVTILSPNGNGVYVGAHRDAAIFNRVQSLYAGGDGFHVNGTDTQLSCCMAGTCTGSGIYLGGSWCRIYNGGDYFGNATGITIAASQNNHVIVGNSIDRNLGDGIAAAASTFGNMIIGNMLHSNSQTTNGANNHISCASASTDAMTVVGNSFGDDSLSNNPAYCIYLSSTGTVHSYGNTQTAASVTTGFCNAPNQIAHDEKPRVTSITSSATPAYSTDFTDLLSITALATNITSMTSSMTGTQVNGQKLLVRIYGSSSYTITWGAKFVPSGVATLPTATVAAKTITVGLIYDTNKSAFVCTAVDATGY